MKRLLSDERGAAYVEFLISFIPLFFLFMGLVQMALMYGADLVVQHAASRASRAAIVVLDDDPERYDGQARRDLTDDTGGEDHALGSLVTLLGGGGIPGGGGGSSASGPGGARMAAIRAAASGPLLAVSPSMQQLTGPTSVMAAIDDPMQRAVMGQSVYNRAAMAVTFPRAPGATEYRDTFESAASAPNLQLTTRVTYLFACSVPLASRLMCESYPTLRLGPAAAIAEALIDSLGSGSASPESVMAELERLDNTWRRYEESQPALEELDRAAAGDMMYLTWATGARFKVLRGEVTLPLQSTRYRYPSE